MTERTASPLEAAQAAAWSGLLTAAKRRLDSRVRATVFGGLAIAIVLGVAAVFLAYVRADTVRNAERELSNLGAALAEQTAQAFHAAELALDALEVQLRVFDLGHPIGVQAAHELMRDKVAGLQQIKSATILDANGNLIASSDGYPTTKVWLGDRPYFAEHLKPPPKRQVIGVPVNSRTTGERLIVFSRRRNGQDGGFNGVLNIALDPTYFENVYRTALLSDGSAIALANDAGVFLARYPDPENFIGRSVAGGRIFTDLSRSTSGGTIEFVGRISGERNIYAPRMVPGYPLVLIPSLRKSSVLADWRQQSILVGAGAGAAALAIFVMLVQVRRSEERSRRHATMLQDAINSLPDGFILWDKDDRPVLWNDTLERRDPGTAADLATGRTFTEIMRARVERGLVREARGREDAYIRERLANHRNPTGRSVLQNLSDGRWIRISETRTREGEIVGIRTDVSDLKKAESDLAQEGQRLRVALAAADIAVFSQDRALRYTWGFNLRLPIEPADLAGKTDRDLYPPGAAEALTHLKRAVIDGDRPGRAEVAVASGDGVITLDVLAEPLRQPDGTVIGVIGAVVDITQRKMTEQQLRQSQKMDAVGALTGGIAHDFNNMLGVIIGNLDMLIEALGPGHPASEQASLSIAAAERSAELVRRLLAFSRKQPLQPTLIDVNEVVKGMEPLLRRAIGETIAIDLSPDLDVGAIEVDRNQLENALLNLSINARDAMPKGGRIGISTRMAVVDHDTAPMYPELAPGDYVALSLTDTGKGIPPDILQRVFEPFFTTKGEGKGTGLGLSMVYGFTRQSGGTAKIYSEPGHGTTVRLYFPCCADETAPAKAEPATEPTAPTGSETILVVEDRDDMRMVAVRVLTRLGYRTIEAANAADAIAAIERGERIDLVFTDIVMPGAMSGLDLAHEIRRRNLKLAMLLTSGYASPQTLRGEALAAGLQVIGKPYRAAELARAIREALESRWK